MTLLKVKVLYQFPWLKARMMHSISRNHTASAIITSLKIVVANLVSQK